MRLLFMGMASGWREVLAHKLRSFLTLFGKNDPILGSADRPLQAHVPGA